jgi:Holliday junction resolvase-like predicted endonuclease
VNVRVGDALEVRTVAWLRGLGYTAERVSRRGRYGTSDLFGCIDVIALNDEGPMFIQVTTKSGASHRRRKIRDANLPVPVRLFAWFKDTRHRWAFVSEEIHGFAWRNNDLHGINEAARGGVGSTIPEPDRSDDLGDRA